MTLEYPGGMDQAPRPPGPDEVRYRYAAKSALAGLAVAVLLALALLLTVTSFNSYQALQTSQSIRQTQVDNHKVLDTIQDCTQPAGDCYRRGQQRTAAAVGDINRVIILAAACASSLPTGLTIVARQNAIQSCVISGLAHK